MGLVQDLKTSLDALLGLRMLKSVVLKTLGLFWGLGEDPGGMLTRVLIHKRIGFEDPQSVFADGCR